MGTIQHLTDMQPRGIELVAVDQGLLAHAELLGDDMRRVALLHLIGVGGDVGVRAGSSRHSPAPGMTSVCPTCEAGVGKIVGGLERLDGDAVALGDRV